MEINVWQYDVIKGMLTFSFRITTDSKGMPLILGNGRDVDEDIVSWFVPEAVWTGDYQMGNLNFI